MDAYFPDQNLVVELDGYAAHRRRQACVSDRRRDLDILLETGMPTVRLAHDDVSDAGIARLAALLQARALRLSPVVR